MEIQYVLQYLVLLEYLNWEWLHQMTNGGTLITTLYQTIGRAPKNYGSLHITCEKNRKIRIREPAPYGGSFNATIMRLMKTFPYNINIFSISNMLIPYGIHRLASSEPKYNTINVTYVLLNAKNFNFVVSMMVASQII